MKPSKHEVMTEEGVCPRCGGVADHDSVDIGVGVMNGPWGCTEGCGWSEAEEYDSLLGGGLQDNGSYLDPQGGLWPAQSVIAKALKRGEGR